MPLPSRPGPFVRSDASVWNNYLHLGVKRVFKANVVLLHPEEACSHLYFVQKGEILTTHFASPEDPFKVYVIGGNAVAGIVELFAPPPPAASWRTLSPCACVLFSRECVENEVPRALLLNLLEQAAFMSAAMVGRFARGISKRNDVRLARYLLHFAQSCPVVPEQDPSRVTILPSVTQEVSSELLGMHPATFNKLLAAFRACGIIGKSKKKGLEILDLPKLTQYARGDMPRLAGLPGR